MERMAAILLVDDDPSVREALAMALEREGHRVDTAATGDDALAQWRRSPPDLILLDLMLPGRDGVEVCQVIRREDQVPIIMLTARSDPIDVVVGLESGADDYVAKPFETRVLLARMKAVLRRQAGDPSGRRFSVGDIQIDPSGMTVSKAASSRRMPPYGPSRKARYVCHGPFSIAVSSTLRVIASESPSMIFSSASVRLLRAPRGRPAGFPLCPI